MNEEIKQIIESLQFLISMQHPSSERYKETQNQLMIKNYLLLNPIKMEELSEKTSKHFALSEGDALLGK